MGKSWTVLGSLDPEPRLPPLLPPNPREMADEPPELLGDDGPRGLRMTETPPCAAFPIDSDVVEREPTGRVEPLSLACRWL